MAPVRLNLEVHRWEWIWSAVGRSLRMIDRTYCGSPTKHRFNAADDPVSVSRVINHNLPSLKFSHLTKPNLLTNPYPVHL